MKSTLRILGLALTLVVLGCAAGSQTSKLSLTSARSVEPAKGSAKYDGAADAVCLELAQESRQLGRRIGRVPLAGGFSPLAALTREIVEPAVGLLQRQSLRLRKLETETSNGAFHTYVSLFDPIEALIRDRVQAGLAGDAVRARELEARRACR